MITTVNDLSGIMFTMENFGDWLLEQLKERNISQSELSRLAGISKGTISNLINGTKGKGPDSLTAIAHALKLPVDLVFEKAKMLPQKPELSPIKRRLIHVAESDELTEGDIELAITLLEQRIEQSKKHPKARPAQ